MLCKQTIICLFGSPTTFHCKNMISIINCEELTRYQVIHVTPINTFAPEQIPIDKQNRLALERVKSVIVTDKEEMG